MSACALAAASDVRRHLGAAAFGTAHGENGCLWTPGPPGIGEGTRRLVVEVIGPERFARAGFADAGTYFLVAAPQVGAAFGGEAGEVPGLGDRAVWGGGPEGGELWILDGERLVGLIGDGVDRAALIELGRNLPRSPVPPS